MTDKKFQIRDIKNVKFIDINTGKEIPDSRDIEPVYKKFDPDVPILDLVKKVYPSYEICNHPLITKYGYGTFGCAIELWYWNDNLSEASEEELWKIYGLIQADWKTEFYYLYNKEVYEFRKYKREHEGIK